MVVGLLLDVVLLYTIPVLTMQSPSTASLHRTSLSHSSHSHSHSATASQLPATMHRKAARLGFALYASAAVLLASNAVAGVVVRAAVASTATSQQPLIVQPTLLQPAPYSL